MVTLIIHGQSVLKSTWLIFKSCEAGDRNLSLKSKLTSALPSGYRPELDASDYLDDETTILSMQLIGILRWLVELGRIDICVEVSMMTSYNCMPRVTHLYAVLHIFSYLQVNSDWKLVMDSA